MLKRLVLAFFVAMVLASASLEATVWGYGSCFSGNGSGYSANLWDHVRNWVLGNGDHCTRPPRRM